MKKITIFASLLLAGSAVALSAQDAQTDEVADTSATQPAEPEPTAEEAAELARMQEEVCRTERVTGSLTRRRKICMTRSEWSELERSTARSVSELQGRASGGQQCTTGPMGGC